jgi:peptide/nickel transport system substrate-binding protein
MSRNELAAFLSDASYGRLNRRQVLERGLGVGVSSALLTGLVAQAPEALAAPGATQRSGISRYDQANPTTFTTVINGAVTDCDPHSNYSDAGAVVTLGCYEMLVAYKGTSTFDYDPMLAESWTASDDLMTYTFKIRANATFHDGSPCTSQHVKDSMVRLVKLEMGPYLVLSRFCPDPDTQITVPDATTVIFTMTKAEPLFLAAMASSYGPYVVNMAQVEANKTDDDPWAHNWFQTQADGTGPYKLVSNDPADGVTLTLHDKWWGTLPAGGFTDVQIRIVPENATRRQLIENGGVDVITNDLTQADYAAIKQEGKLNVITYPTTRADWIIFNYVTLPVAARQGLAWAFPYDDVVQGVYANTVKRTGPITDNVRGYDPDEFVFTTDLDQAKTLLEQGGFGEGTTITIQIDASSENSKTVASLFQANLAQVGVTLDITAVDSATQDDTMYGDAPAEDKPHMVGLWAWWPDYNDGWNQLAPNFLIAGAGGGGSNAGFYNNPTVEGRMKDAELATDEDSLDAALKDVLQIIIHDDPAAIFIGQVEYTTIAGKDIQNLEFNPLYLDQFFFNRYGRAAAS